MKTFDEYLNQCTFIHDNTYSLRLGQILFNELIKCNPNLANKMIDLELDSFYTYDFDISPFIEYIEENWDESI